MDTRDQAPARGPDAFSPLRAENVRRAAVAVTVVAALALIGAGIAWLIRPTASAAETRACELAEPVLATSADELIEAGRGDRLQRALGDVRDLASQAGNGALVEAARTAGTGLAELTAGPEAEMGSGQASALFERGRVSLSNECARLIR